MSTAILFVVILSIAIVVGLVIWWKNRADEDTNAEVDETTTDAVVDETETDSSIMSVPGELIIMPVGNSSTTGIIEVGSSYRQYLAEMLTDRNVETTFVGNDTSPVDEGPIVGYQDMTIEEIQASIEEGTVMRTTSDTNPVPNVALIHIGPQLDPPDITEQNMSSLIDTIRTLNSNILILIGTLFMIPETPLGCPYCPPPATPTGDDPTVTICLEGAMDECKDINVNSTRVNSMLQTVVGKLSTSISPIVLANMHSKFNDGDFHTDGLHLTDLGNRKMAQIWLDA